MARMGIFKMLFILFLLVLLARSQIRRPKGQNGGQPPTSPPPPPPPPPPPLPRQGNNLNNGQSPIQNNGQISQGTTSSNSNNIVNTETTANNNINIATTTSSTSPNNNSGTSSSTQGSSTTTLENQSVNPNSIFPLTGFVAISAQTMQQILDKIDRIMFVSIDGELAPRKHLRGIFHDCTQGCDGRISLDRTQNRGLQSFVNRMDEVYYNQEDNVFRSTLSRPDFWVLCARRALAWAIKKGSEQSGTFPIITVPVFNYGRPNNSEPSTTDNNDGPFPMALGTWEQIRQDFIDAMKNRLNEADLVALQGTHYLGTTAKLNSGFGGAWGGRDDRNVLTHELYTHMTGAGEGSTFRQIQTMSGDHQDGGNSEIRYGSAPPPSLNNPQWTVEGEPDNGQILLNSDMNMYHVLQTDAAGHTKKKWCPQQANGTLYDCSRSDSSYMPLRNTSSQVWKYATDQRSFYNDLIHSFFKMTSVPSQNDSGGYFYFAPEWICEGIMPVCVGDIFFQNCRGLPVPNCFV